MNHNFTAIIGGSGFVGSFLLKESNLETTINYDKNQSPFFPKITTIGNVLNKQKLKEALKDIDSVILLAAEHRDDVYPKSLYYDVNVEGTKNVLEIMDFHNIKKIIFTSSVAVYGLNKNNPNENHKLDPFNHYGKSKRMAEELIKDWYNTNKKNKTAIIIRPTVIFGERNRGNVYNLLAQISSKRFVMIGTGKNKKSMAYVKNVVGFINHLRVREKNGLFIYNYADKPDLNMNELVKIVENTLDIQLLNIKIPYFIGICGGYFFQLMKFLKISSNEISAVRVKKFCATTQFDSSKMLLEYEPSFSLIDGINKTIEKEFINNDSDEILFYSE